MDWVSAGAGLIGALGGLFGQKSGPSMQELMFQQYSQILNEAMRIYNTTDLEQTDRRSLADFRKNVDKDVNQTIDNFNARQTAAGYGPGFSDTERTRTIGRVAKEGADQVATMEADLERTRPGRKLALLPNAGAAAGGFDMAARLDAYRQNNRFNEFSALSQIAEGLVPLLFPKREKEDPYGYRTDVETNAENYARGFGRAWAGIV